MNPALELLDLVEDLEGKGTSVIELVRDGQPLVPWRLYPGDSGIFDRRSGYQFYYHSHGADHEAGHFHTVRLFADHTAHLVAVSMTPDGWPQALFTLNLWAIGDTYESAADLRRYVRRFHLGERVGPPPLVRFVNLIFQVFGAEIERLQDEKIAALAAHRAAHPDRDVFEDRSLEVLSRVAIDIRARAGEAVSTSPRGGTGDEPG
jgi:hypothetical protein